jgi:exonuclease III
MKILIWNIRGLGNAGRRKLLVELIAKYYFDCICLQETIKSSIRQRELDRFACNLEMHWFWVPCRGHSGGMLMGVNKDLASVSEEDQGAFYQSLKIKMIADDFEWTLMNVYGPAHDDGKLEFLEEICNKIQLLEDPVLVGGDFNLVRTREEKSSGNVNVQLMDAFNEMIDNTALRELQRSGSRYTWSNKQITPIMCVLDRVLVSNSWEDKFNLATVFTAPRVGSDHNPLIVDTVELSRPKKFYFRFNSQWLHQAGFHEWVKGKWPGRYKFDVLDHWHII